MEGVTRTTSPSLPGTDALLEGAPSLAAEQNIIESSRLGTERGMGTTSPSLPGTDAPLEVAPSLAAEQNFTESPGLDAEVAMGTTSPSLPGTDAPLEAAPRLAAEQNFTESPGLDAEVAMGTTSPSLPGTDAPLEAAPRLAAEQNFTESPGSSPVPAEPQGLPEHTAANGTTAAPVPSTTEGPGSALSTTAPPCPEDEEPPESCEAPTEAQKAAVAEALGTFALRFYQRLADAAEPGSNLLFSPINVALALSHLLLGEGQGPALGTALGTAVSPMMELRLQPRFLNASRRLFGAPPRALSGNESLDLARINAWVREATRGHLPRLLEELPPDARLVLLSAVYFQAKWRKPFRAKETEPRPFQRPGRPPVPVPTMSSKKYPVASFSEPGLRAQVGRLQLSQGLSLVLLLPTGALGTLGELERALSPAAFLALVRKAVATSPRATVLALPRFRLDLAQDVVPIIHDMGKEGHDYGLFLDAELCGLAPEAAVDALRHRAVLALDEAGVEAAAATAASLARSAPMLEALRPFLFAVVDDASGLPLFMGRLSDPQP
uniref:Serpin family G member 1 n=1 Tax=Nothoprocta perdicaria TaxID=30464 RepID=A0A8C7E8Y4_NOTPE